jgi:cytochrome c556
MGRPAGAALAAAFLVLGAGAVIAQSDPIATRKGLMKENEENAVAVVRMMRGQAPFDAAKVEAAFAQWTDTAQKLPSLFPDNSKSGQKTRAAPKIWTSKADFDDKAAAFGKVVAENRDKA